MASLPPAHGFDGDELTRRLLRSPPPPAALRWAEEVLGASITRVEPLGGGTASAVHLVKAEAGAAGREAVLRRYVRPEVVAEEPDIAEREGRALRFVERLEIPTPRLLAVDADGSAADAPALLMDRLPGRVEWSPTDMRRWLQRLAEPLPIIHAAPLPPPGAVPPYSGYTQQSYDPPAWATRPGVWTRAVEIFHGPSLDPAAAFIHRDYHPGNVLWRAGRVTGIVDWASASMGPPSVDVGHCRGNLIGLFGLEVADAFTAAWEALSGERYNAWGDVMTIIGFLDGLRDNPHLDREAMERALARAVAELDAGG